MTEYREIGKDIVELEEEVLEFWKRQQVFSKSLEQNKGKARYVFYEGPPTANGKPHIGHMMPRVYKDLFPRYKTMQGLYVGRKGGWDTHGLPVELEVEKEIGLNSKLDIEEYGVEEFVEKCKESVWRYKADWERMIERMGFWIDLENAYVTYTDDYIETVWWELAQMFNRKLLYRGHKILPYCPRCGTGLSSHEVAQGYREVEEPSIFVEMKIMSTTDAKYELGSGEEEVSLLTWTTTPWTLPANVGLAIAPYASYMEVELECGKLIVAKDLAEQVLPSGYRTIRQLSGRDLVGIVYAAPYPLVEDERAYRVHAADFVNLEEGTGIVHTAPAFGEEDYELGQQLDLPFFHPVNREGEFTHEFSMCEGMFVKDADARILEDLEQRELLYQQMPYRHDYPFCWRCDTPLLYYAMDSWYIRTTEVKEELIANNQEISWFPSHIGEGRLGDFLSNLKDWALSRDRYWGTPLNLWICKECDETIAIESREQLVRLATDKELANGVELHRPYIDEVELECPKCGEQMDRVSDVIDTWFDSGSMHSAQWHYPFENKDEFKNSFPADFICEAEDQTRGWFYTLLATSTIIHNEVPFKNCITTGLGLDEDGVKMSKRRGNVVDPWDLIERYGADCLRWYFFSSSAPWRTKRIGEAPIKEVRYRFLETMRNTYNFFALYASIDVYDTREHKGDVSDRGILDQWVLSRLGTTINRVIEALDGYDVVSATQAIEEFVDDLSNWYVRASRRRFWKGGMDQDKIAAYDSMYCCLMGLAKLVAPFIPFFAEEMYQELRREGEPESVHLCSYPSVEKEWISVELESEMTVAREVVSLGHKARNQAQIKVRQPLASIKMEAGAEIGRGVEGLIKDELNIDTIEQVEELDTLLDERVEPVFASLGPRLGKRAQEAGAWLQNQDAGFIRAQLKNSGSLSAEIDGSLVKISKEDVSFSTTIPECYELAKGKDVRVLLDIRMSDQLRERGMVREIVHGIQLLRKEAGFDVTDRIILGYCTDEELEKVIDNNCSEIESEILAEEVVGEIEGDFEYQSEIEIDDGVLKIALSRVAK